jgi:hypothetical protein
LRNLGLGEILQLHGWVTRSQLNRALALQRRLAGRIGSSLLEIGAISEKQLLTALSEQLGIPKAAAQDLENIPQAVRSLLPKAMVLRWRALVFRADETRLWVVSDDPRNIRGLEELAFASGRKIHMHVAPEVRIHEALERYYAVPFPQRFARLAKRLDSAGNPQRRFSLPELRIDGELISQGDLWGILNEQEEANDSQDRAAGEDPERAADRASSAPSEAASDAGPRARRAPAAPRIELSEKEREELLRPAIDPSTTALARARLRQASTASEIGKTLLEYLTPLASRVALFTAHADHFEGWMATGPGLDAGRFSGYEIDFGRPSTFLSLHHGVNFFVGPLPDIPVHQEFLSLFGGAAPVDCVMVPIRLRRRLLALLYVDRLQADAPPLTPEPLKRLAEDAAKAFENCILRNRLHSDRQARFV